MMERRTKNLNINSALICRSGQTSYEVTNAAYRACVEAGGCKAPGDRTYYDDPTYADHPVVWVDWFMAQAYAAWRGCRLPSEAEWEYAARGPDSRVYPWGNQWAAENSVTSETFGQTAPVGSRPGGVSWVGALDMSGNVWEWTRSLYEPYPYDAGDGREADTGDSRDVRRVLRGGSWRVNEVVVNLIRAIFRNEDSPGVRYDTFGFRVVCGGVPS